MERLLKHFDKTYKDFAKVGKQLESLQDQKEDIEKELKDLKKQKDSYNDEIKECKKRLEKYQAEEAGFQKLLKDLEEQKNEKVRELHALDVKKALKLNEELAKGTTSAASAMASSSNSSAIFEPYSCMAPCLTGSSVLSPPSQPVFEPYHVAVPPPPCFAAPAPYANVLALTPSESKVKPYRVVPCRHFTEKGFCTYGENCAFKHDPKLIGTGTGNRKRKSNDEHYSGTPTTSTPTEDKVKRQTDSNEGAGN